MLQNFLNKNNIKTTKVQQFAIKTTPELKGIVKVYSFYNISNGIVVYCRGKKDIFVTLRSNGSHFIQDGFDGGNLSKYYPEVS